MCSDNPYTPFAQPNSSELGDPGLGSGELRNPLLSLKNNNSEMLTQNGDRIDSNIVSGGDYHQRRKRSGALNVDDLNTNQTK